MTNKGNGKPPPIGRGPNAQLLRSNGKKKVNPGAGELAGHCTAKRGHPSTYSRVKQHQEYQKDTKMSTNHLPVGTYPRNLTNPNNPNLILINPCPNPKIMQHILIILIILIFLKKKKGAGG